MMTILLKDYLNMEEILKKFHNIITNNNDLYSILDINYHYLLYACISVYIVYLISILCMDHHEDELEELKLEEHPRLRPRRLSDGDDNPLVLTRKVQAQLNENARRRIAGLSELKYDEFPAQHPGHLTFFYKGKLFYIIYHNEAAFPEYRVGSSLTSLYRSRSYDSAILNERVLATVRNHEQTYF